MRKLWPCCDLKQRPGLPLRQCLRQMSQPPHQLGQRGGHRQDDGLGLFLELLFGCCSVEREGHIQDQSTCASVPCPWKK